MAPKLCGLARASRSQRSGRARSGGLSALAAPRRAGEHDPADRRWMATRSSEQGAAGAEREAHLFCVGGAGSRVDASARIQLIWRSRPVSDIGGILYFGSGSDIPKVRIERFHPTIILN